MPTLPYDKTSPQSIESYAKKLVGLTFLDVLNMSATSGSMTEKQINKRHKGALGNLLEEIYFQYHANNKSVADFEEAGVELKATPFEYTRKNELRAGERLVLSMINYNGPIEADLYKSHLWEKCKLLLLVYYWRDRARTNNLLYQIRYVQLFTPSDADLLIIKEDYRIIVQKVMSGEANKLMESETKYLGACTKGTTAAKSRAKQYYPPHTLAQKRAFCYKKHYMTYVLNKYVAPEKETCEPLIKDVSDLQGTTFSKFIIDKINKYRGQTDRNLCSIFGREYNNNKAQWTDLVYRMLGIKSNCAEEFRKANVTVKVIRLEENGKMRENMSFPQFKYRELVKESWEKSTVYEYFEETQFFFVVFRRCGDCYILRGCKFWNMPADDLNGDVMNGWKNVVDVIKNGVKFSFKSTKSGIVVKNNLPKKKDNRIIHVRPHTQKRYFEFLDGTIIGNGNRSNSNQLPDGTWMPNYSFWINNDYIISQLDDDLIQK